MHLSKPSPFIIKGGVYPSLGCLQIAPHHVTNPLQGAIYKWVSSFKQLCAPVELKPTALAHTLGILKCN